MTIFRPPLLNAVKVTVPLPPLWFCSTSLL
jgi:hypothetical protein